MDSVAANGNGGGVDPDLLIDNAQWSDLAEYLHGLGEGAADRRVVERVALQLMSRGTLDGLRESDAARAEHARRSSLGTRILLSDAAVRVQAAEYVSLERLVRELSASDAPLAWRLWMDAVCVEHFLWRGDLTAFPVAAAALTTVDEMPRDPIGHMGLARLQRVGAVSVLISERPDRWVAMDERMMQATLHFAEAALSEEQLVTAGLRGFIVSVVAPERGAGEIATLRQVVDDLELLGSDRMRLGCLGLAAAGFYAGDLGVVFDAAARARQIAAAEAWAFEDLIGIFETLARLADAGPTPETVTALVTACDGMRDRRVPAVGLEAVVAGHLLDHGAIDAARALDISGLDQLLLSNISGIDYEIALARMRLHDADADDAIARIDELLDLLDTAGLERRAALEALRVAADCERIGRHADAERLNNRGREIIGPIPAKTTWERRLLDPDARRRSGAPIATGTDSLVMLAPDVEVHRRGNVIRLPDMAAQLLAYLAVARKAVTLDQTLDYLWPEIDPDTGRNRLGVLVHRIRRTLELATDELVIRRPGEVLLSTAGNWRVDAWEFDDKAASGTDHRLEALELYRSHLCARQFAYDDVIGAERERLRALWSDIAADLLKEGLIDAEMLAQRALRLGIHDPVFLGRLASSLRERGLTATADALVTG